MFVIQGVRYPKPYTANNRSCTLVCVKKSAFHVATLAKHHYPPSMKFFSHPPFLECMNLQREQYNAHASNFHSAITRPSGESAEV